MRRFIRPLAGLGVFLCLVTGWSADTAAQTLSASTLPDPAPVNQPPVVAEPALAPQLPTGVAVGRTKGSFAVSPSGSANYSIPIWTPKGIAGMQASLALVYSSQADDGLYGVGWNVSGLSAISRCSKTVAQDPLAANVFLTSADLYCLNGNKLRSFGGTTYGTDGAQYQTELADFSLVISHGVDVSGTGPLWFEVHGKNGLIYQYGNTSDSALLATGTHSVINWALNRITDRFGNHIDYAYTNDTTDQVLRINTITYTTPSSTAVGLGAQATANYQVQFAYVSRTSPVPGGFITGAQFMEPYLAQTITVAALNGSAYATVRTYNLTYTVGIATGRSTLYTVQECSPTQCFSPTTMTYQSGQTGWGSAVSTSAASTGLSAAFVCDLNADGIQDIVYVDKTTFHWYYLLGSTSGTYQGPYDTGLLLNGSGSSGFIVLPIDSNGDGKTELLVRNTTTGNWRFLSFSSPGGAFTAADTTVPVPTNVGIMIGDVDGDGRDDLIYGVSGGAGWTTPDFIYYRLSTASNFGAQQLLAQVGSSTCTVQCKKLMVVAGLQFNSHVRRPDVNGDGRVDFFANIQTCNIASGQCLSPSYGWDLVVSDAASNTYDFLDVLSYDRSGLASNLVPPLIGDFNGDGCSDVASDQGGIWYVQYGTCLRTGSAFALSAAVNTGRTAYGIYPMALDWDGDGRDDIVDANSLTGGFFGYYHSTGTTLGAWTSTGISFNNADTLQHAAVVVDVHGDGQYGFIYPVGTGYTLTARPHSGTGAPADLATSFTDGFGVNYSPTYVQTTNLTYYLGTTGAVYPEREYPEPINVVGSYTASDGTGSTYTITQNYGGARFNVRGRGLEGFVSHRQQDSRTNDYHYDLFGQLYPYTGMVSGQTDYQADGTTHIRNLANTLAVAHLDTTANNQRDFPYVSQGVDSQYEFGGSLNGQLITQITASYTFAGANGFTYGNPSKIVTTTVDEDPTSPWTGKSFIRTVNITPYEVGGTTSTGWCINLPSQISETRTQPAPGGSLTHTTSYTVNQHNECEVDGQTAEPSSTTDKVVTTYAYTDACGNVNSTTATGQNPDGTAMNPRTSTAGYGPNCIYPETLANALSQQTLRGYRYDLGLLTSSKDPNLLITSWTYNDIGQKTLEQRPDGTQTSYSLTACTSNCGNSTPVEYYLLAQQRDATSGHATFVQGYDYYDQFNRLVQDVYQIAGGQYAGMVTVYDALGRVSKKSSPSLSGATAYYTTNGYDLLNRVTSTSRPISATNPTLEFTNYTYQGRTQTVQDPKGYITTRQSDVIGELGIVTDPDGVSKTNYGYDPFSNLTSIKDPAANTTTRTFDSLGYLLTGSSDPDRGIWTLQYDSLGELVNLRDAKTTAPAWTQQLTYDLLGRTLTRLDVAENITTQWTWGTSQAAHEIGRLAGLSGFGDFETYTFDSVGRPNTRSMGWNTQTYTVSYAYNNQGQLDQLTYPLASGQANPFAVKYGYTTGYLSSLQNYTGGVAGTTFWKLTPSVVNMDPWGHVTDETLGTTSAVRIQSAFDGVTGWIGVRTVGSGGSLTNLSDLAYSWDPNGNLSQRQDINRSLTEAITYDNLNRFQSSTLNGTQNQGLVIDNTGNITSRTSFGTTYPYTYDTVHKHAISQLGSPAVHTYTYDANGNMATRDGQSFVWASFNLPTSLNNTGGIYANFFYGPDRQRKQQVANYNAEGDSGIETTTYVFGLYEHESTPAQTHDKYFVQVPGGTQILYDIQSVSGTQTTYITADHLGSASVLINSAGSALITESYEAYGRRRASTWGADLSSTDSSYTTMASTTRRGFTDGFHESLDNVSLIHMNGRIYDPIAGRFLSPDPVITRIGDSQRGNPYSYVENRPLTLTDPTGLEDSTNDHKYVKPTDPDYVSADYGSMVETSYVFSGYSGVALQAQWNSQDAAAAAARASPAAATAPAAGSQKNDAAPPSTDSPPPATTPPPADTNSPVQEVVVTANRISAATDAIVGTFQLLNNGVKNAFGTALGLLGKAGKWFGLGATVASVVTSKNPAGEAANAVVSTTTGMVVDGVVAGEAAGPWGMIAGGAIALALPTPEPLPEGGAFDFDPCTESGIDNFCVP